jgi:hypothetical protein
MTSWPDYPRDGGKLKSHLFFRLLLRPESSPSPSAGSGESTPTSPSFLRTPARNAASAPGEAAAALGSSPVRHMSSTRTAERTPNRSLFERYQECVYPTLLLRTCAVALTARAVGSSHRCVSLQYTRCKTLALVRPRSTGATIQPSPPPFAVGAFACSRGRPAESVRNVAAFPGLVVIVPSRRRPPQCGHRAAIPWPNEGSCHH